MIKCFNCGYEIPKWEGHIYLEHMICENCYSIIVLASLKYTGVNEGIMNEFEECTVTTHRGLWSSQI